MAYTVTRHTPTGKERVELSTQELLERAKEGDRKAVSELVKARGGYDNLSAAQQRKVIQLLLMEDVSL